MSKILVAGSINMDLVVQVDHLPHRGESLSGKTVTYIPGGKGANQAVAASRLGAEVSFLGKVGNDGFGEQLYAFLASENLQLEGVQKIDGSSGTALITVDPNGNNTIIVIAGSNGKVDTKQVEENKHLIEQSSIVIAQHEIPQESNELVFKLAKEMGKTTILNPAPARDVSPTMYPLIDYLILNQTELSYFMNEHVESRSIDESITCVKKLQKMGFKSIVLTLGPEGALSLHEGNIIKTEPNKVKAIDTTAAGDCFVGAFTASLLKGESIKDALFFANKAASLSVQRLGASSSLPYLHELT